MRKVSLLILVSLSLGLTPPPSYGWNRTGHRATALIAYRQLDEATRKKVAAVLRKNPIAYDRWEDRKINDDVDVAANAFMHASTFPDDVRPPSRFSAEFHRAKDHYVNFRYVPKDPGGDLGEPPTEEENILNSYRANLAAVEGSKPGVSEAKRAVALCWIFHQEGDIHMPLHAIARFSGAFPEGDHGGNLVRPFPNPRGSRPYSKNLHAYWDDILADDDVVTTFDKLDPIVDDLVREYPRSTFSDAELKQGEIRVWALESANLARKTVYRGLDPEVSRFDELPIDYESDARKLGRRRIALAGYRLAEVLKMLFSDSSD